jgi:hypothetical protein
LNEACEKPTVLNLVDAYAFLFGSGGSGDSGGTKAFNTLLRYLEGKASGSHNLRVIVSSTRARKIIESLPDMNRRVVTVENLPVRVESLPDYLKSYINYRSQDERKKGMIEKVKFTEEALNAIALLGESYSPELSPPTSHTTVIDALVDRFKDQGTAQSRYEITEETVIMNKDNVPDWARSGSWLDESQGASRVETIESVVEALHKELSEKFDGRWDKEIEAAADAILKARKNSDPQKIDPMPEMVRLASRDIVNKFVDQELRSAALVSEPVRRVEKDRPLIEIATVEMLEGVARGAQLASEIGRHR